MADDLHTLLVASLTARLERARAADADDENTTGWWWDEPAADSPAEQHIALCRPATVIRQTEALLRVVELAERADGIDSALRNMTTDGPEPWIGEQIIAVLAAGEGIEVGE